MAVTTARQYHTQQVHYLRKTISYTDNGSEVEVGRVPAGALIKKESSGVHITTAFNASAGNVLQLGTNGGDTDASDDPNVFGTSLALGTATFVPADVATGAYLLTQDTIITATVELTGTAATAGSAEVIIEYIPDNDG